MQIKIPRMIIAILNRETEIIKKKKKMVITFIFSLFVGQVRLEKRYSFFFILYYIFYTSLSDASYILGQDWGTPEARE